MMRAGTRIHVALCGLICLMPVGALATPTASSTPTQALDAKWAASAGTRGGTARPAATAARQQASAQPGGRGARPVLTATADGPERPGYVHYFLLTFPDESLETLVGIELPGRRIAWSFPDLGVVVAPLVGQGMIAAGGKQYAVSHLYGIRPFPDDAAMGRLRKELAGRVERWVSAGTPYCENDGPRSACMSCLGFVLRVLFPGRISDFPQLPADFRRALHEKSYSTEDLLLYLTGMMDLPGREARLRRLDELGLPDALREDVVELVAAMDGGAPAAAAPAQAAGAQKAPASRPAKVSTRPAQRKRL